MEISIKIQQIENLIAAINNLAGAMGGKVDMTAQPAVNNQFTQQPITQQAVPFAPAQVPMQQPVYNQAQVYSPQMQSAPPVHQNIPVQPPIQQQVPTSHTAQSFTQDQLAVAMTALVDAGKGSAVMGILAQFGAETLMQVPKEQYATLATMLRGAGANI